MLEISSAQLKARILPYGATLAGVWHKNIPYSLILGSDDAAAYRDALAYFGAVVGPVANRISGACVRIDGADYRMDANEGRNTLHSGKTGTHARTWSVTEHAIDSVTLSLHLPDGSDGLPGNRILTATYTVTDEAQLHLTLAARSDTETVMNLAHHPYWKLDTEATIAGHTLLVNADHYLPVDADLLPTGDVVPVAGTDHDFSTLRTVPVDFGIDENFCLSDAPSDAPRHAATLTGSSGVTLDIDTTEPGLQVYTGGGLPDVNREMLDDRSSRPFAGIALEPQRWPDAPKHRHFPAISLPAGGVYRQKTVYRIGTQLSQ